MGTARRILVVMLAAWAVAGVVQGEEKERLRLEPFYDNGFVFESEDHAFRLQINGGIQFRYSFVDYDETVAGNQESYSNFYLRRARLWFRGHAYDPRFTYFIHIQLEPTRSLNAHDVWLEYRLSDLVRIGVGRNKIAYGLEFLNSGGALQMVERSVFSGETDIDLNFAGPEFPGGGSARFGLTWLAPTGFATGGLDLYRSQGIQLSGLQDRADGASFEYQLGLWNGRSTTGLSNSSDGHLVALRAGWYPRGWIDWRSQGDGSRSGRPKLGLIGSVYRQRGDDGGGFDESGWNVALLGRYRGLSLDGEWGTERFDYDDLADTLERRGWRLQAGAFVIRHRCEVVARYATVERLVDPTYNRALFSGLGIAHVDAGAGLAPTLEKRLDELSLGLNWFFDGGHRHKIQADLSLLRRSFAGDADAVVNGEPTVILAAPDQQDRRLRVQLQLVF